MTTDKKTAIIATSGTQYTVSEGDTITVNRLQSDSGEKISFDQVLMVNNAGDLKIGAPTVEGAKVDATILNHTRGDKVLVFKKKRRQGYKRKYGHRQDQTTLLINSIS